MKNCLIIGGVLNILLGIFHFMFWAIFDWPNTIECLNSNNKGILEVLNIHGALAILFFGYLSIFRIEELQNTKLGRTVILFVALFYLIRLINEFIFWPYSDETIIMAIFLSVMTLLYVIPFISLINTNNKKLN